MTAAAPRSWSTREAAHRKPGTLLVDAVLLLGVLVAGTLAAWPIYATPWLLVTAAGGALIGAGAVLVGHRFALAPWAAGAIAALAIAVLGIPLATPAALSGIRSLPALAQAESAMLASVVTGWRDLITVPVPVGDYQGLLVPFLVVVGVASAVAAALATSPRRWAVPFAPAVLLLPLGFGVGFGSSDPGTPLILGPVVIAAPRAAFAGLLAVGAAIAYLVHRAWAERRAALARAAVARAVPSLAGVRRGGLGAAVSLVAAAIAIAAAGAATPGVREVLRTTAEPVVRLPQYASPLTGYRASFADAEYGRILFRVSGDTAAVPRLRLAVLSNYDGLRFSAPGPGRSFARIPQLERRAAGLTVSDAGYTGVWLPAATGLASVSFGGARAAALTDGFAYDLSADAGIDSAGLRPGDSVTLAAAPHAAPALSQLVAPADPVLFPDAVFPASLGRWIDAQQLAPDAKGLGTAVRRLREYGYLSHSLELPGAGSWFEALGEPSFEPSYAGESTDRVGALFTALLAKPGEVAAVGDDEQFAAAVALLAEHFGFPARIVLGFDLAPTADPDAMPACAAGECRGADLTAWVEVQGAGGEWAIVDVTPQHTVPPRPDTAQAAEPHNPTEVTAATATDQQPPEAAPAGAAPRAQPSTRQPAAGVDWFGEPARIGAASVLGLLILASPLLAMLLVKALRRRSRRRAAAPRARIAAGWDEYVDDLVDRGIPVLATATRTEVAGVSVLATLADAAAFSDIAPTEADADAFWALVGEEEAGSRRRSGLRRHLLAALSIRSFLRRARPASGPNPAKKAR